MKSYKEISQEYTQILKFKTLPVGFKFLENESDLEKIKNVRKLPNKIKTCQMISLARVNGWTIGATLKDFSDRFCPAYLGLCKKNEHVIDGRFRSVVWFKNIDDAIKCEQMMPGIEIGKFQAIAVAPLRAEKFVPDVVLFYGTPAQLILMVNAMQWENYEQFLFHCVGESGVQRFPGAQLLDSKASIGIAIFWRAALCGSSRGRTCNWHATNVFRKNAGRPKRPLCTRNQIPDSFDCPSGGSKNRYAKRVYRY